MGMNCTDSSESPPGLSTVRASARAMRKLALQCLIAIITFLKWKQQNNLFSVAPQLVPEVLLPRFSMKSHTAPPSPFRLQNPYKNETDHLSGYNW